MPALLFTVLVPPARIAMQPAPKSARIGVLLPGPPAGAYRSRVEAFRRGLRELGYDEGKNAVLEFRWVEGDETARSAAAADLVRQNVDVIVTGGTPLALAAKRATSAIPIVVAAAGDFIGAGLVRDLGRPDANVTGTSDLTVELSGKRLELLRELLPKLSRVGVLWNAGNPGALRTVQETEAATRVLGLTSVSLAVRATGDLDAALDRARREAVGAVEVVQDPFSVLHRRRIIDLAERSRLPAIYGGETFVEDGGLIAYGADIPELYRRAATFVDKLLKGAKVGDLPVEQPTKFALAVNLKTAKAVGVTIPRSMLLRADRVIE